MEGFQCASVKRVIVVFQTASRDVELDLSAETITKFQSCKSKKCFNSNLSAVFLLLNAATPSFSSKIQQLCALEGVDLLVVNKREA